jgi:hypothetical protein
MDECYFHPSRKYANEEVKFIAKEAMNLLWEISGIVVKGIYFSNHDIRKRIINEMSCEDLDRAITEAISKEWNMSFVDVLILIFEHILLGDRLVEIQMEQTRDIKVV